MSGRQHRSLYRFRNLAILLVTLGGIVALAALGNRIAVQQQALRSASTDDVQWSFSQTQVELLRLIDAVNRAETAPDVWLGDVRQRFDIFYSRINTLQSGTLYGVARAKPSISQALGDIRSTLSEIIPLIDGSDAELRGSLPDLQNTLSDLLPQVRQLALEGVELFAAIGDRDRQSFSDLLVQTGILAALMILALLSMLAFVIHQSRQAAQQARDIAESNERYASMVNSSLDAIIVSDAEGRVVDFNPAAESTFGYSRNAAIGEKMHDLIIPPAQHEAHKAGMARFLETGIPKIIDAGRVELEALHANGSTFPVELSLGTAGSSEAPIFIGYIRDISSRIETQDELTRTRDMALAAAKAKSDFLAVMSHEMRTPLNGVLGLLDLMTNTSLTPQQKHYVQTALRSGEILQEHINNVLDMASLDAGAMKLNPTKFDLKSLIDEVVSISEPAAIARNNKINIEINHQAPFIVQDSGRLKQILINLIGNAVKFTENGTITVTAKSEGDKSGWVELDVVDTGVGMSEEDCSNIFEDFVMLDPSYQRTVEGTGLGLAISKRIAELMGGEIGASSVLGEGSRFWLRFPVLDDAQAQNTPASTLKTETNIATGLHVLLVEDNETNRLVAREMLLQAGCTVQEAHDGLEGVECAKNDAFDLILMDVSMPKMDGITATRAIKNQSGPSSETPIIGLTAHAMQHETKQLLEAGMQDCLVKPLRDQTLRMLLADLHKTNTPAKLQNAQSKDEETTLPLDPAIMDELVALLPKDVLRDRLVRFLGELSALENNGFSNTQNSDEIAQQAHAFAGSAAVFGASPLREKLLEIEKAALRQDQTFITLIDEWQPILSQTRAAIEELVEALDQPSA